MSGAVIGGGVAPAPGQGQGEVAGHGHANDRHVTGAMHLEPVRVLERLVDHDGDVGEHLLRSTLAGDGDQLRGLTGPISKHVKRMIGEGALPPGTKPPSFQRAKGLTMAPELVIIFRLALGR